MKEFITNLKVFEKGLSPVETSDNSYLESCVGVRITDHGMLPFDFSTNPSLQDESGTELDAQTLYEDYGIDFQSMGIEFIDTQEFKLLFTRTGVYKLDGLRLMPLTIKNLSYDMIKQVPLGM